MFELIRSDIECYSSIYKNSGVIKRFFVLCFTQELHAVIIYRFGRWTLYKCKIPVLKSLFKISYFLLRKYSEIVTGIGIWPESDIGPYFKIEHWGGVYIKAKIGKNCRVSQQVVIGHIGGFKGGGVPTIKDNVYIGAGAKILGDIEIGNNVIVGANSVVIKDVIDNGVVVGIPGKIVKINE